MEAVGDGPRPGSRLSRLARVTGELSRARTVDEVSETMVLHCADAVDAVISVLFVRDGDDHLRMVALRGGAEGDAQRWERFPIDDRTPLGVSVLTGERVVVTGAAEISRRFPALTRTDDRTLVALPLRAGEACVGTVGLTFLEPEPLDAAELEFLDILADSCAQALERIRAQEAEDRSRSSIAFLAAATTELSSSLDYEATLTKVARLAVPSYADWCAVDLLDGERLHRLAVAHVRPEKVELAQELHRTYADLQGASSGRWQVVRTGTSMLVPEVTDEMLVAAAVDDEHLRLSRELGLRSVMLVPLVARGRVFGVITFVAAESGRTYAPPDLEFAEDLAGRAAVAIDNAELHSQTVEVAARLQRAVLLDSLPEVPDWELAKRYDASGRTDVGGDFFDVLPLPDGRLALFVGDVMGRGVKAAAAMARMRSAVTAYAVIDASPASVMSRLDVMFEQLEDQGDDSQLVTLVYALADPDRNEVMVANAGHPAPMLLCASGDVVHLPDADGAPLGAGDGARREHTVPLGPGDTLVAFTDGLIERRSEDLDAGRTRVAERLGELAHADLQACLDLLVDDVCGPARDDDVAVLVARRVSRRRG